jgi:predicted AAA+ superfamily ATPase
VSSNILKLANDSKLQQIPDTTRKENEKYREILYITGASGSGKSYYTKSYIKEFQKSKKYKDFPVYLFSALTEDDSLDEIKPKRIRLDESIIDDPISIDELENSLCIFDDTDVIGDKKYVMRYIRLLDRILEVGRHKNIFLVCN